MFERIAKWYRQGLWTAAMVQSAVKKGVIPQAKADEIIGAETV